MSPPPRLHEGEAAVDEALARRLVRERFPAWADLPLAPVAEGGTDHVLYRLGRDMVLRLPRLERAAAKGAMEQAWLPRLAPRLPLAIPEPVAAAEPGGGYPWPWSVWRWIEGEPVTREVLGRSVQAAHDLAGFLKALQAIDASDGPAPGKHNFFRGQPITVRDAATRAAIEQLDGEIDARLALAAWETAMAAAPWDRPPVWVHGDMIVGNLLMREGRLVAVIDFGGLGVGDPACDLMAGWCLFDGAAREEFRQAVGADDDTWTRARGWALHQGLLAAPYYRETHPAIAASSLRTVEAVLAEFAENGRGAGGG